MDYEKKYKEALERAKSLIGDTIIEESGQHIAEVIFPELAESEDERIRKRISQALHGDVLDFDEIIQADAWLEKQGEQKVNYTTLVETGNGGINALVTRELSNSCDYEEKPVGKVEPKFHEGEWITNGDYTWKIIDVKPLDYILQSQDGNIVDDTIFHVDEQFNLWTIQDAKPGDVLAYGDNPNDCHVEVTMIFKSVRNEKSAFTHFHFFDDKFRVNDWCDCGKNAHPATKEQCDSLMKAMTDAGYEWNEEKKELKLLITNGGDFESENCEQKPAWSEEDERLCSCLIEEQEESLNNLKNDKYGHSEIISDLKEMYRERIDWLKALKQRIGG